MNFKKTYLLTILLAFGVFAFGQVTITVQNVVQNCNNSSITFFVSVPGGQTYSGYVQSPGGLLPFTGTGSGTQQVSGLGTGYYMAVVDVLNGNPVNFESIEVYIYGKPQPAFTGTDADHECDNGIATASVFNGGLAPFTYLWSNGDTTQTITNLAPGTYSATVTDANGCTANCGGIIEESCPEGAEIYPYVYILNCASDPIYADVDVHAANPASSCATDFVGTLVMGGSYSEYFTFTAVGEYEAWLHHPEVPTSCFQHENLTSWGNPIFVEKATVDVIDANCADGYGTAVVTMTNLHGGTYSYNWNNGATDDILIGPPGTYSVTITVSTYWGDNSAICYVTIGSSSSATSLSSSVTNNGCNGNNSGAIDLSVSGGTPDYTYLWSNGATTEDITNLAGGTYTVTVTDAVGCVAVASAIVSSGSNVTVTTTGTDASCFGSCDGTASATASGGWPAYSFVWSNGATTQSITGLCAGTYTVTVTDDIGCTGVGTFIVGNSGSSIIVTITSTNIPCPGGLGGSATASPTGGTGPHTYFWERPTGFNSTTPIVNANGNSGLYSVTVTDANGCTGTGSVVITEPSPISTTVQTTDSGCGSVCTGTLFAGNPVGGTPPYSYFWSNGTTTYTGQSVNNVCPGTWTLTITDANGCTKTVGAVVGVDADITPPTIVSCPADITISCLDYDLFIPPTDMPTATDDCSAVTVSVTEDDFLSCGNGYYYRLFTVSDLAGNTATCEQLIVIEPEPVTEPDIIFPDQHQYVEVCSDICGNIAIPFAPPAVDPYLEYCGEVNFVIAQQNTLNALPGDSCTIVRKWLAYDCLSNLITPNLFLQTVHVTFDPDCSNFSSPITVYPNPFMDEVNMLIDFTGNLEILIAFAGSGQTVYYFNGFVSSTQQIVINFTTQNFPPGLYYVAVTTPDGVFTELMTYQP